MPGPSLMPSWLRPPPNAPLNLPERPLQEEPWEVQAFNGGILGEPGGGWPGFLTGLATSGLPLGKIAPSLAVMLPFLRGNKALQAERLSKLTIPGPSDSVLNQQFELLKKKYPRTISHFTASGTNVGHPQVVAQIQQGMQPQGMPNPHNLVEDLLDDGNAWAAHLDVNPKVLNLQSPMLARDVLRHEVNHLGQAISNKSGLESLEGRDFARDYRYENLLHGYDKNKYEVGSNKSGMKDVIKDFAINLQEIPARYRQEFITKLNSHPDIWAKRLAAMSIARDQGPNVTIGPKYDEDIGKDVKALFESYKAHLRRIGEIP